jgi:ABC-type glycerol-3-phosphate transport system substrate-binding protein
MTRDDHVSRRKFLRTTAAAGAAAGLGSLAPSALSGLQGTAKAAGSRDYTGKLVVIGIDNSTPNHGTPKLLNDFEKLHPGLSIDYHFFDSSKFVALFTAAQASGEQIDVLDLNGQDLRRYALAGDLIPLDSIPYKSRFQPLGLATYSIGGHLWALPFGSTGGFPIFYNNALLKKAGVAPPRSYADFQRIGNALKGQGASVFTHDGATIYLWPVWFFTTYAQVTRNKSVQKTLATLSRQGKFTDPEVVQALQLIFNFASDKLFSPDVLSLDTNGATAEFLTGKAAFWLHYDGIIDVVRTQTPPNMDLRVMLIPPLVKGPVKSQFPGGTGAALGIYSKIAPERKAIAMELLEFLTRDANDTWILQDGHNTLGTNIHATGSTDPVALAEKAFLSSMTIYLDWYWPPEITRAFQEGIQAGITGNQTAQQVASNIQLVFDGLVAGGYKFQH